MKDSDWEKLDPPACKLTELRLQPRTCGELLSYYAGHTRVALDYSERGRGRALGVEELRVSTLTSTHGALKCEGTNEYFEKTLVRGTLDAATLLFEVVLNEPFVLPLALQGEKLIEWTFERDALPRFLACDIMCLERRPRLQFGYAHLLPPFSVDGAYVTWMRMLSESLRDSEAQPRTLVLPFLVPEDSSKVPTQVWAQLELRPASNELALKRLFVRASLSWLFSEAPYKHPVASHPRENPPR